MVTARTRIGFYEILDTLGEGGMGLVYRAADTKLGRRVALKMLPASMTADEERLARFDREARTLASLNHPHIAQIYGIEVLNRDGIQQSALVKELTSPALMTSAGTIVGTAAYKSPEQARGRRGPLAHRLCAGNLVDGGAVRSRPPDRDRQSVRAGRRTC
jgi:serine/threonine protein kinase